MTHQELMAIRERAAANRWKDGVPMDAPGTAGHDREALLKLVDELLGCMPWELL